MAIKSVELKPAIGSEVFVDKQGLADPATAAEIRELLVQRGVLVFREANLSDEQQVVLAKNLGSLRDEGVKGIFKITLDRSVNPRADYLKGSMLWHIDGTHDDVPVFASLLSARQLSETGGETEFANSYLAYEKLPEETKRRIADLKVVHSFETSMRRAGISPTDEDIDYWRSVKDKTHSLVWTHACGRRSLVIGCHADHVVGMDREESDALLQELLEWTTQPQFVYRHEWTPGDMIIWDNTGVLHRVLPYSLDSGREMHRTTLLGEEAFS